jgi:hypothetical protein
MTPDATAGRVPERAAAERKVQVVAEGSPASQPGRSLRLIGRVLLGSLALIIGHTSGPQGWMLHALARLVSTPTGVSTTSANVSARELSHRRSLRVNERKRRFPGKPSNPSPSMRLRRSVNALKRPPSGSVRFLAVNARANYTALGGLVHFRPTRASLLCSSTRVSSAGPDGAGSGWRAPYGLACRASAPRLAVGQVRSEEVHPAGGHAQGPAFQRVATARLTHPEG